MIPDETIAEIKRRTDLSGVVGRYVSLKKRGKNHIGLCPFHQEKTPSFNVHDTEGYFKCFGCGAGGDVFAFLERVTGQGFFDLARELGDACGVEVETTPLSPQQAQKQSDKKRMLRFTEQAALFFRNRLNATEGEPARQYLFDQRAMKKDVADAFGLGFGGMSDDGLTRYIEHDLTDQSDIVFAERAGLIRKSEREGNEGGYYDFYRRRLIFPIKGVRGSILAFGGRSFLPRDADRPKYVNGPTTPLYDKTRELYGLFDALPGLKRGTPAVLVEGYFDVVATHRAEVPTGVAPCGTSLTSEQIELLKKYTTQVTLCMDADKAGEAASARAALLLLSAGFTVRRCGLVHKDPDETISHEGEGGLKTRLLGAPLLLDEVIDDAIGRATGSVGARVTALRSVLPYLAALQSDSLWQSQAVKRMARAIHESEAELIEQVEREGRKLLHEALTGRAVKGNQAIAVRRPSPDAMQPAGDAARDDDEARQTRKPFGGPERPFRSAEQGLLRALLCQPQLAPRIAVVTDQMDNRMLADFVDELRNALIEHHEKSPREVLSTLSIPEGLASEIIKVFGHRGMRDPDGALTESEARALIDDYLDRADRQPLALRLREVQRAIEAVSGHDPEQARELLAEQSELVQKLRERPEDDVAVEESPVLAAPPDHSSERPVRTGPPEVEVLPPESAPPGGAPPDNGAVDDDGFGLDEPLPAGHPAQDRGPPSDAYAVDDEEDDDSFMW